MKRFLVLISFLLIRGFGFATVINNLDGTWSIRSSSFEVTTSVTKLKTPVGSILNLTAGEKKIVDGTNDFFALRAGDYFPSSGEVVILDTNKIKIFSPQFTNSSATPLNLSTEIEMTLVENHLFLKYRFEALDTVKFPEGLDLTSKIPTFESFKTYNHTGEVYSFSDTDTLKKSPLSVFPILEFRNLYSTLWVISRNPYWGLWNLNHISHSKEWTLKSELLRKINSWTGPASYSILGPGDVLECSYELVLGNASEEIQTALECPLAYFSPFPNGNEQIVMMMFDNIPFEVPKKPGSPPTWFVPKSGQDTTTPISHCMVRLLEDHPRMKQGWLILLNYVRDSSWVENPEETRWWRVNGKYRNVLYHSTEEYRAWLRNIENANLIYGYEDQARLGSHGLHHTPSDSEPDYPTPDSLGPGWEFEHNDSIGAESTFVRIEKMYDSLGLTNKSLRFIRPPGFKTCASLTSSLLRHGFKVSDYSFVRAKSKVNTFVCPVYSPSNRLWLLSSTWSGDTPDNYDSVKILLQKGKYVLTAGHPWAWFDGGSDTAYDKINKVFTAMETDFPHLDYLFPDEYGDFMDELRDIHNISYSYSKYIGLVFSFNGKLSRDETLVIEFDPDKYKINGNLWMDGVKLQSYEIRGKRIFIILPHSNNDSHVVTVPILKTGVTSTIDGLECIPNITNNQTEILFSADPGQTVNLTIYNIAGQVVRQVPLSVIYSNNVSYTWDTKDNLNRPMPGGVYFVEAKGSSFRYKTKLVILR